MLSTLKSFYTQGLSAIDFRTIDRNLNQRPPRIFWKMFSKPTTHSIILIEKIAPKNQRIIDIIFSMNRLVMNSSFESKKPKRDPIMPFYNWRRTSKRFNPGPGALNKVETTWLPVNPDLDLYDNIIAKTKSDAEINISDILYDIPVSARTRITHLENLLERLRLSPNEVLINGGVELDDEVPITSLKVKNMKDYILVSLHNLDRIRPNNPAGLFPKLPFMLWSLSSPDDSSYEITMVSPQVVIDCYKHLAMNHPTGAEGYLTLRLVKLIICHNLISIHLIIISSTKRDILNENMAAHEDDEFKYPVGYEFSLDDTEGSSNSITNVFLDSNKIYEPTLLQKQNYTANCNTHRRGQLGALISRRGLNIKKLKFSSLIPFLGYPIRDLKLITNNMDMPTMEHTCKNSIFVYQPIVQTTSITKNILLGMLEKYHAHYFQYQPADAIKKLRRARADMLSNCPQALRRLQENVIRAKSRAQPAQKPLTQADFLNRISQPQNQNQNDQNQISPMTSSPKDDNDILARVIKLETNSVNFEQLKKAINTNNLENDKRFDDMQQQLETQRQNSRKLLNGYNQLRLKTRENELNTKINRTLLGVQSSIMMSIDKRPSKLKSYNKSFRPTKTSLIADSLEAVQAGDNRAIELSKNNTDMHVDFEHMDDPPENVQPLTKTPLVPYMLSSEAQQEYSESGGARVNLDNIGDLTPRFDHTGTEQGEQLSIAQNPVTNGKFQGKWSPIKNSITSKPQVFKLPSTPTSTKNGLLKTLTQCKITDSPRKRSRTSLDGTVHSPLKIRNLDSPQVLPKPNSILSEPLFNLVEFGSHLANINWPEFKVHPMYKPLPNKSTADYIKYYNVAITQPDKLFEILVKTVKHFKPIDTNPLQSQSANQIISEAEFYIENNFTPLHCALSNEIVFINLLDTNPNELFDLYPAPPVSRIFVKHILDSMSRMNITLPNFTTKNLLAYTRLCLIVDRPDYIEKYFPGHVNEVQGLRRNFINNPLIISTKHPTKVNPHLKITPIKEFMLRAVELHKPKDNSVAIRTHPTAKISNTPVKQKQNFNRTPSKSIPPLTIAKNSPRTTKNPRKAKTPTRSTFTKLSDNTKSVTSPTMNPKPAVSKNLFSNFTKITKSVSASDVDVAKSEKSDKPKKLTKVNSITDIASMLKPNFLKNLSNQGNPFDYIDHFIKTNLSLFHKPWVYMVNQIIHEPNNTHLPDPPIPSNEPPNLPAHEQLHHTTGDQAADHFFELDGFHIPEDINEQMLHPKPLQKATTKRYNFQKSTDEDFEKLPLKTQLNIKTKLAKIQIKKRLKKLKNDPPPLDTKITMVSTNLNAPLKQFQKLILKTDYPEIVCVNELKLTESEILKSTFYPTIYTPYYTPVKYKDSKFVFSIIFVKTNIKAHVEQVQVPAPFTMIDLKLKLTNGETGTINVCTFYRPHFKSKYQKLMNIRDHEYYKYFQDTFSKVFKLQTNKTCLLTGDLNCQYKNPRDCDNRNFAHFFDSKAQSYKDLVYAYTYAPTHTNDPNDPKYKRKSRIDPCLTKGIYPTLKQLPGRSTCGNDGHSVFKLTYEYKCLLEHSAKTIRTFTKTRPLDIYNHSVRKLKEAQPELEKLKKDAYDLMIKRQTEKTFEPITEPIPYLSKIIQLFEDTVSDLVKPIDVKINKYVPCPPLSTATKTVRDEYHNLTEKSLERPLSNAELYDLHQLDKHYNRMSRNDSRRHLVGIVENSQNRPLNQSQRYEVNRRVNKKNKNAVDESLDLDKITKLYEKQINHFKDKAFVDYNFNLNVNKKLGSNNLRVKWHGKTKRDSVYKAFLEIKETTCGYNSKLNKKVLGCFHKDYIDLILDLIYFCLEIGYFPPELKKSKIVPINKSKLIKSKKDLVRLRFLGIQNALTQIMMKFVSYNYGQHVDKTAKIIPHTQHGFRNFFSTSTALNETFIRLNLTPKNQIPILVFVDIEKAFDSVCHTLLAKLLKETCEPNIAQFLIDEHKDRTSYVVHNGIASQPIKNPNFGVYQGGCMSPIEFSLFLQDFTHVLKENNHNVLFADDCVVTAIGDTNNAIAIIQDIENQLKVYLKDINMDIMPDKTIVMLIGSNEKINFGTPDQPRYTSSSTKHLGVTFSNQLFDFKNDHPFHLDILERVRKIIDQRGTLFQIENMGYNAFRKQLGYLLNHGVINYAFESLPVLSDKLYNKINKITGQTIVDLWKLDPYPKVNYEYSYLFKLSAWPNAQNSHTYNTLNYLNRTLIQRKPPLAYKEIMRILYIKNKPYVNPNSQLAFERKIGEENIKLGYTVKVHLDKNRIRSDKYYPYNLQHFFNKVPQYILSYLGTYDFKYQLSQHFKDVCNHRAGKDKTCKFCKNYSNYYDTLTGYEYESNTVLTTVPRYHRNHATTENFTAIENMYDKIHTLALSLPFIENFN